MSLHSKVVWSQGMFLLPHHFQQEARHVEYTIDMRLRATGPHALGLLRARARRRACWRSAGSASSRASGILPDGTPFSMPLHDAQPMALDVPADMKGELVCLAVPLAREGVTQVGFDGCRGAASCAAGAPTARSCATTPTPPTSPRRCRPARSTCAWFAPRRPATATRCWASPA